MRNHHRAVQSRQAADFRDCRGGGKTCGRDLNIEIAHHSNDEPGTLAEMFREMSGSMKAVIRDIDQQLGAMSDGDFTVTLRQNIRVIIVL